MVEDAKFWVVEPRITLSGISGLGTLLSGNYIGFEAGKSDKKQRSFTGLEVPPIITGGQPGRQFVLKASDLGSLGIGSPIYYRRLPVGQVIAYDLAPDGKAIEIKVFVNAPYDKYVNPGTRFWNASGIDVSVGADGVDVRTESLVALLAGGLAFDTPPFAPEAEPAAANTVFTLYSDRATAMKQPDADRQALRALFQRVAARAVGGRAGDLPRPAGGRGHRGRARPRPDDAGPFAAAGGHHVLPRAPHRALGRTAKQAAGDAIVQKSRDEAPRPSLQRLVEERGLRAQLQSGSLLTGQLYVAFDYFPNAPKAKVDWSRDTPELPVVPSTLPDLEAKLTSILAKLDKLPLEAIGNDFRKDLDHPRPDAEEREQAPEPRRHRARARAEDDARRAAPHARRRRRSAHEHATRRWSARTRRRSRSCATRCRRSPAPHGACVC